MKALNAWQWQVLVTFPAALLLNFMRLRIQGFVRTLGRITPVDPQRKPTEAELDLARLTGYAVLVAARYGPWWPRCLLRSVVLGWFLARRKIPFEIKIGLPEGKPLASPGWAPDFAAHAWVESGGVVLNDRADIAEKYRSFEIVDGGSE
ncbi:MAG: lasso peptide biosynthesis B2 protein [Gammaproteobacteria bacterium]|nr:lasso peptide biosynthesis B2 protein [Gammaproteobacteria bacterium]